jgi:hypothetical protein
MAERDVDIYIGIRVQTEELEKASALLKELAENLQKIQSIGAQGIQPMAQGTEQMNAGLSQSSRIVKEMSSSVSGLGSAFSGVTEGSDALRASFLEARGASEGIRQALKILPADFDRAWTVAREIPYSDWRTFRELTRTIGKDIGYSGENLDKFVSTALTLRAVQRVGFGIDVDTTGLEKLRESLNLTEGQFNRAINIVRRLSEEQVQVQIGVPDIGPQLANVGQGIERIGKQEAILSQLSYAASNAHKLQGTELSSLASILKMSESELVSYGQSIEKTANDWKMYRAYIVGMRGAIGPLGYAFRDVTMQMYWASLGFLFMTMTMGRAERAALTAKTRAFDLAKAYYNLAELQKEAAEAAITYGAGSEEARKASINLQMAEKQLELQQESLRVALKTEVLAGYQMLLTTIPLTVNTIYGMITAMGALNGMLAASRASKINDALANVYLGTTTTQVAGTTYTFTTSLVGAQGAEIATAATTGGLTGFLHTLRGALIGTSFAASLLRTGLMMGIGLLISFGISSILVSRATEETNAMMRQMTQEAKAQASAWEDLSSGVIDVDKIFAKFRVTIEPVVSDLDKVTEGMKDIEDEAKGHSLYESIQDVINIFLEYGRTADDLRDTSISYSITGELEQVIIPKIEDQTMSIVQVLRPVEIPRIQDEVHNIIQQVKSAKIPEVKDQVQFISQELNRIEIPEIEDQSQLITQKLITAKFPQIVDQTQIIKQVLSSVNIPEIENKEQKIVQVLNGVDIPEIRDQYQTIYQILKEAEIRKINDQIQKIEQKLVPVDIPEISNKVQNIIQKLTPVEREKVKDQSQNIIQFLKPVDVPKVEDQTQIIRQILKEAEIPEVKDKIQNIKQKFIPTEIPEIEPMTGKILLEYIVGNVPEFEPLLQNIILNYSGIITKFPDLVQNVNLEYENVSKQLADLTLKTQVAGLEPITKNNIVLNISFPNLTIREQADINNIAKAIDNIFQANYYGEGGRVNV